MTFETKRLFLREWKESDAPALYRLTQDPEIGGWCGWPPLENTQESLENIRELLNAGENYAITLKDTGEVIGAIAMLVDGDSDLTNWEDEGELGFWLGRDFWGHGYIEEASAAILDHAFTDLDLSRMWASHFEGNTRSYKAQTKLGFSYVRKEPDVLIEMLRRKTTLYIFSLKREDWHMVKVSSAMQSRTGKTLRLNR